MPPKRAAKVNGNGVDSPRNPSLQSDHKAAPQFVELSLADRQKMEAWLHQSDKPFSVATVPLSRKRKRDSQALSVQQDLFDERLTVQYEIKPRDKWESLRRYRKFTVGSESIATGQCILVKHDEAEDAKIDVENQWKAKVLEVRALDTEHVYVRVAWLNRPEDLSSGRKPYHGKHELVPTNEMDIIDAMTVNGTLDVIHWDESEEDDGNMMHEDQYFWRQTYDHANTKTFSKLRQICIDSQPQNPDETILQCSNEGCRKWLHAKCLAEKAVERAASETSAKRSESSQKKGSPKNLHIGVDSPVTAKARKGGFTSEVYIKDLPNGLEGPKATENEIVIIGPDGQRQAEDLSCLFCHQTIED